MTEPATDPDNTQETFISHLVELRSRLMKAIIAVIVVLLCLFPFAKEIYAFLAAPLLKALPHGSTMIATDVTGTFLVPLKVTLMAAFLIALPYVLYQMWAFVAPGLYRHEQRLALPVIVSSVFFFGLGMAFAYFAVFPIAFGFFANYAPAGVQMMTDIDKYLSFVLTMFIAFGATFETPVVVIVLVRLRVVTIEKLKAARPYIIVGAFVIGAIFTPPDVISQLMLAVPLWLLFELGIVLVRLRIVSLEKLRSIRPYVIVGAFVVGAIFTPPDVVSQLLLAVPLWLLYEFGILMARFFVPPLTDDETAGEATSR